jgi:uncharacterized protein YwgA
MVQLAEFIQFLDENELVDASVIQDDTSEGLLNRIKLQKLVYFAQEPFGQEFERENGELQYNFSSYKYGPYSTGLASEYYSIDLSDLPDGDYDVDPQAYLETFDGKSAKWLEIAATLYDNVENRSKASLVALVNRMKPRYNQAEIEVICDELTAEGLINFN